MRRGRAGALVLLATGLTVAPPAMAYLDPSTGSMILSAIIGMFATAALALKTYWYKLKALFRGDARREGAPEAPDGQDGAERD